jgi:hypothetical protein
MPRLRQASFLNSVHYEMVARQAEEIYLHGSNLIREGFNLFDTEWTNIRFGQAWAALHTKQDAAAAGLCSAYHKASPNCLKLHQPAHERIR